MEVFLGIFLIFIFWLIVKTHESGQAERNKIEGEKNDEIRRIRKVTGYSEDHEKLEEYQKSLSLSLRTRGLKPTKKLLNGGEVTKQFYNKYGFRELDYVRQQIRYYRKEIIQKKKKNK
jgi:hypothetical protein